MRTLARRVAAGFCWLGAAAAAVLGMVWYVSYVTGLDPDDPLCSESVGWAVVLIGGGTLLATAILAGAALVLSPHDQPVLRRAFGWVFAVTLLIVAALARPSLRPDSAIALLVLTSGSFLLLWRTAVTGWERRPAFAAAVLSAGLALATLAGFLTS